MVGLALSDKAAISSPMVTVITANLMIAACCGGHCLVVD